MYGASKLSAGAGDTDALVRQFVAQTGVTFPIVRDREGYELFFTAAEGPTRSPYPLDVLIGPDGRVVSIRTQYLPEVLTAEIEALLGP